MSEKVHHFGLEYTPEEWARLYSEHTPSDVIFTYKSFGFNYCAVCLTPTVEVLIRKPFRIEITAAESPNGRWDCGYSFDFSSSSSSGPAMFCAKPEYGFASEKEAVYHALRSAEKFVLRALENAEGSETGKSDTPKLNVTLREIRKYKDLYDPSQLSLFEWLG